MKSLTVSEATLTKLFRVYVIIIFATTVCGAVLNYLIPEPYNLGDWLINYSGGFVRRGVTGELAALFCKILSINPGIFVVFIQIVFYGLYLFFSLKIFERLRNFSSYYLLVFSLFLLSFQVNSFDGGYRKEILFLVLLSGLVWTVHYRRELFPKLFRLSLLLYPFLVLSHEMLILFLPYLLALEHLVPEIRLKWSERILLLLPSAVAFFIVLVHPGGPEAASAIRESLERMGVDIRPGAINWVGRDLHYALEYTLNVMKARHYELYCLPVLLTIIAFQPVGKRIRTLFLRWKTAAFILISLTGTLALAMVAIDWGRFIYVNASAICFLSTLTKREEETDKGRVHLIPLLLYSLCWRLPHVHPIETFFLVSKKTGDVMPYLAPVQWLKLWLLLLKLA